MYLSSSAIQAKKPKNLTFWLKNILKINSSSNKIVKTIFQKKHKTIRKILLNIVKT